jgi:pilus assembly protein Flp/PilA
MLVRLIKVRDTAVERGATAVEYALLAAMIAGVIVVAVMTLGTRVVALFSSLPPF